MLVLRWLGGGRESGSVASENSTITTIIIQYLHQDERSRRHGVQGTWCPRRRRLSLCFDLAGSFLKKRGVAQIKKVRKCVYMCVPASVGVENCKFQ